MWKIFNKKSKTQPKTAQEFLAALDSEKYPEKLRELCDAAFDDFLAGAPEKMGSVVAQAERVSAAYGYRSGGEFISAIITKDVVRSAAPLANVTAIINMLPEEKRQSALNSAFVYTARYSCKLDDLKTLISAGADPATNKSVALYYAAHYEREKTAREMSAAGAKFENAIGIAQIFDDKQAEENLIKWKALPPLHAPRYAP